MTARYPSAGIQRVDGSGGDQGIDSFAGTLANNPRIWQCKHFANRIQKSQRLQVLKSIKSAIKHQPSISSWTLCVPINLRTEEQKWFQDKVVSVYGSSFEISLLQASDFFTELQHNRELRDMFFPENAVSKMMEVRKALTLTEGRTPEQLEAAALEYAQQYLEGAMAEEPRLQAVVAVGGTALMRQLRIQPGLVFSHTKGERTTHYFARNIADYQKNPIEFSLDMLPEYRQALNDALDTGARVFLPAGSLLKFETSSPFLGRLFSESELANLQMEVAPRLPDSLATRVVPLRFLTGKGEKLVTIPYIPFRITRMGRKEMALTNEDTFPAEITIVFRTSINQGATISIALKLANANVETANQLIQFLEQLRSSLFLRIESVEHDAPLLMQDDLLFPAIDGVSERLKKIISEAAMVAGTFRTPLRLPASISTAEAAELSVLHKVATGEIFTGANWNASITKSEAHSQSALNAMREKETTIKVEHLTGWRNFKIFGTEINPGPVTFIGQGAKFLKPQTLRKAYLMAKNGESVPVQARCTGACHFIRGTGMLDPSSNQEEAGAFSASTIGVEDLN